MSSSTFCSGVNCAASRFQLKTTLAGQMTRLGAGPCVFAQMLQPRERLHGFAEAHVVGEQRAELEARGVGEKMEARFSGRAAARR